MTYIREIREPDRVKEIFRVARSAWGMEKPESFISDLLNAIRFHGGLVLGAYEKDELIGFLFGVIGRRGNRYYLYSHMTGVSEQRKYSGIGYRLKLRQREWAARQGYELVAWTFDPLMSLNGSFNIRKLGAISRTYLVNFYGTMTDRLNYGVETDRFIAEWWTARERRADSFNPEEYPGAVITSETPAGFRKIEDIRIPHGDRLTVEIPFDYVSIKGTSLESAIEWRLKTRKVFRTLFRRGYTAVSFTSSGGRSYYLFDRQLPRGSGIGSRVFDVE
ncbi:MAG: hypothetical protein J9259_05600 [Thermoplasmata archaeon YP2-bin.285]|uniref:N-acetyltransferase domain-containing protein n=1 Tax=Candidatus Sysuiplasma superficiale TaxID=2823368 RepID=A0A8J7YPJ1_9ARCH|nr:hypothetical protein [Candidatus Sysuiplasma superficiale]